MINKYLLLVISFAVVISCKKDNALPSADLVCYLPMNGNALDASRFADPTQVQGATLTTGRKTVANTAYQMDGVSSDIIISNSKRLDTIQHITLTAWIKPVTIIGKIDSWGTDIYLGKVNNASQYTPGTFGDIRIYNRALSANEISELYLK